MCERALGGGVSPGMGEPTRFSFGFKGGFKRASLKREGSLPLVQP